MALVVPQSHEKKRVKVYELRNNDWFDRGTGFCTGYVINDESKIQVESEDEPDRMLLETRITKDDGYQKQQDTLIVWTETNGTDMALSFQEAEGCATIWEFVSQVQQQLIAMGVQDDALSDDAMETFSNPLVLPPAELKHLPDVERTIREVVSTPHGRDALSKLVIGEDYIQKLIPLVSMAEDLESLEDLHHLCNIMKMMILLNDSQIIEHVVTDDVVMGVVGALEYDPDFPRHKANHRKYLSDNTRFKEVVRIADPTITRKIHSTWRLQYLKDVVLARILDDPTFSVLNSLIFFNQVDIVSHLQSNTSYLEELFGIIDSSDGDVRRKKDAIGFMQQCCAIAKNLQAPARATLYNNFIQNGLLRAINFALLNKDASVRVRGTDILVAMIDHDPSMVRAYIMKNISEKKTALSETLVELLLVEVDLGVKAQAADAIRVLLEPQTSPPAQEAMARANGEFVSKLRGTVGAHPQTETFINAFYEGPFRKLFQPLKDLEHRTSMNDLTFHEISLLTHLIDILMFLVGRHTYRSKYHVLQEGLAVRVAQLFSCPQKHLQLIALKFFRSCIGLQDDFYYRQITQHNLLSPILDMLSKSLPRDNLLNSACLELFEFIKRENIKDLIVHIVESHRERLVEVAYIETFQNLLLRYDQIQGYHDMDSTLFGQEGEESPSRNRVNGNQRWQAFRETDAVEEAYFNTSDDEDELASSTGKRPKLADAAPITNGASPVMKTLVDYPDDDDDMMDAHPVAPPAGTREHSPSTKASSPTSSSTSAQTPPERVSEKRRREEDDDEDELGKLSHGLKRRNSVSSMSSTGSNSGGSNTTSRRKKPFVMHTTKDTAQHGGKKIEISLGGKGAGKEESESKGGNNEK